MHKVMKQKYPLCLQHRHWKLHAASFSSPVTGSVQPSSLCHVTRVQQHEMHFSASSKALCLIKTLITEQQMTKRFQIH